MGALEIPFIHRIKEPTHFYLDEYKPY